jgi:hypothetical protein
MNRTLSTKTTVLGQFWLLYRDEAEQDPVWADFLLKYDVGLPLSYMLWADMVTEIAPIADSIIEETWNVFCSLIEIDPEGEYDGITSAFEASDHEPLK